MFAAPWFLFIRQERVSGFSWRQPEPAALEPFQRQVRLGPPELDERRQQNVTCARAK
jgi:hypothetical protein